MNRKLITTIMAVLFCCVIMLAGCGKGNSDSASGDTKIQFYSWGNETEVELTRELVKEFNETNKDGITVEFTPIPSGDYETKVTNALRGRNVPDVIIAGDGEIKSWIEKGGISVLDDYVEKSEVLDLDKMWTDGVERYRYDVDARKGGQGKLYGIVRDYSPSGLFYNVDAMEAVGISCISLTAEESMAQYGTAEAYFEQEGQFYFNNKIALDWDQFLSLSQKLTSNTAAPVRNDKSITKYGIYNTYWFPFGWSVGGNCLQWVEDDSLATGGKYEFTLFDETKNYKVNEGNAVTVNKNTYEAGEIVSYSDKAALTTEQKAMCAELPSQMEAMQYFVDLSVKHGVSPKPEVSASNSTYGLFSSQQCAMLLDTCYAVGIFRETIGDSFDWDVAPCPVYKDGIPAGHSGSLAYCIPEKSTKKEAAFMFKKDGKYYLTYSANYYASSLYSIGLAVSDNPLTDFQKVDYNPILEANVDWSFVSGTGHNSFFKSPDGSEMWIAYHSHIDTVNGGSQRKINFDRIEFDTEGRLIVQGPSITPQVLPSGVSEYKNIASEAKISVDRKEGVELLTDGIINYLYNDIEVYEYASEGKNKITFTFEEAKEIKAIMVYDSADYALCVEEAKVKVGDTSFDLAFNPDYRYIDEFDYEIKIPGSAAIVEFDTKEANEVTFTFKGNVNLNEIVILGK